MSGFTCVLCSAFVPGMAFYRSSICPECRPAHMAAMTRAMSAVRLAVLRGDLDPVTTLACADCGEPAQVYDHRDYTRPLDVEPVCRSCNHRRGPAGRRGETAQLFAAA